MGLRHVNIPTLMIISRKRVFLFGHCAGRSMKSSLCEVVFMLITV